MRNIEVPGIDFSSDDLGASIGGSLASTSHTWHGDIAEVIIFDRVLTYEEIVELETYLKRKWGILEGCRLPVDTTGYNVSQCNTAGEAEGCWLKVRVVLFVILVIKQIILKKSPLPV